MRRKFLTLLLLVTMTPSASELVEWGLHLASHGDFAHASDEAHDVPGTEDEHGCTPLFHACGCHAGTLSTAARAATLELETPAALRAAVLVPIDRAGRSLEAPPLRPPIG